MFRQARSADGSPVEEIAELHWDAESMFRSCLHTLTSRVLALRLQTHLLQGAAPGEEESIYPDMFAVVGRVEKCISQAQEILHMEPKGPQGADNLRAAVERLTQLHPELQGSESGTVAECPGLPYGEIDWLSMLEPLIDNSREAGATRVQLAATRGSGGVLAVALRDNGPGFPWGRGEGQVRAFVTGKPGHHGLGLIRTVRLAHAGGGYLRLCTCRDGGAGVELRFGG